jgi:hypothetical protein
LRMDGTLRVPISKGVMATPAMSMSSRDRRAPD